MPYRLKANQSIPDGIKRIVLEELDSAMQQLEQNGAKRPEAIHEARKSMKKIRGAMRLVEGELGGVYRSENTRLRDAGRRLSEIRDSEAVIEVFDAVLNEYKDGVQKNAFSGIRRGLESRRKEMQQRPKLDRAVRQAMIALRGVRKRVESWPLENDGFDAIAQGLKRRYKRGRDAMGIAHKDPTPENYHEWRKRVKDHWYHVRLLESLWTEAMQAREGSLHELETWLGDDHNLVVLCAALHENPERFGGEKETELFEALAAKHQERLREKSASLAERIYEEKPAVFVKRLGKLWDTWHKQPRAMQQVQKRERDAAKKQPASAAAARKTGAAVA